MVTTELMPIRQTSRPVLAASAVIGLTALGIGLALVDPALAGSTRPHATLTGSVGDATGILQNNARVLAARGLPAIAVPGVDGWRRPWVQLLAGREVTVIMDCDEQGRAAAAAIESDLSSLSVVRVLDLAPDRNDGYDVTDWLLERKQSQLALAVGEAITSTGDTRYGRL